MTQLTYESPADGRYSDDLRTIASRQKAICVCILIYLVALFGQFLVPQELRPIVGIVALVNAVVACVFVFTLAIKLYGVAVGILMGIFTLVPLVGLLVLFLVNSKATRTLKANGIPVGLFGARGGV